MKSKTRPPDKPDKNAGANLFEIAFLALPFLSLIPNTFVVPPLGYEGLATQEFYFACAMAVFAGLGLWRIIKARRGALEIKRDDLLTLAMLALFILYRKYKRVTGPGEQQTDFVPLPQTTQATPAMAGLDPRAAGGRAPDAAS